METNEEKYRKEGMREGHPGNVDPNEHGRSHPAKNISGTEPIEINESALGHNQSYKASEEHIDDGLSQIDDETRRTREAQLSENRKFDSENYTQVDDRDHNDSTTDWDAENNRTGRQK